MDAHQPALLGLGPLEARVMNALWKGGAAASVGDVLARLNLGVEREISYSAVKAVLLTLTRKGWVEKRADGRANLFSPKLSQEQYQQQSIAHVVRPLMRSHRNPLLAQIVDEVVADDDTLAEFERLLKERKERRRG